MNIVIVGNGLSGTILAKTLRELDPESKIVLIGDEKHLYYPRPNLIEYLAGNLAYERLFAFREEWYREQGLELHLDSRVTGILRDSQSVETDGGRSFPYDRLVLANGAYAAVPPFQGKDKRGIFTLRTLDDALAILDYMAHHPRVAVIGGGLLGLEIARAVKARGRDVDVYEFFPRLLPRQLDSPGADVLKRQIENLGIRVHLDVATEEILGEGEARGLRFKDGGECSADMVIVAAGLGLFAVALDFFSVQAAVPSMAEDLDTTTTTLQWVLSGYLLAVSAMLVVGGRLADIFGRRRVLVVGLAIFGLASLVGGASQSAEMIIVMRIIQGVGAAIVFPVSISVVTTAFPPAKVERAVGLAFAVLAIGQGSGPFVG
ncbi:MAG: MFS transporter, partial [Candidatus Aminicenantaceae bacterium]